MGSVAEEELEADPSLDELNGFRERIEPLEALTLIPWIASFRLSIASPSMRDSIAEQKPFMPSCKPQI